MAVGFHFSRLIVYFLFLPSPNLHPTAHLVSLVSPPVTLANATTTITTTTTTTTTTVTTTTVDDIGPHLHRHGPVFVGRHPIRVRPWPHPDPAELLKAHNILAAVQQAQRSSRRLRAGPARPIIAVTPTTTSPLQTPSLTSLAHTLRLVDAPLIWVVVEAGHRTDAVSAVLSHSNLDFVHLAGPTSSTARLRMHALREIRERRMDGVVVFADESGIHRTELFDEAQKVKSVGAVAVGILGDDEGSSDASLQAPVCDAAGQLVGFHVSETVLPANRSDALISSKMEWAGFVVNSRVLWKGAEARPQWVRDLAAIDAAAEAQLASPLVLVSDTTFVEPLANCSRTVLAWSLRSEALHHSKFPHEWKIDPPLVHTAPRRQTMQPQTPHQKQTTPVTTKDHN